MINMKRAVYLAQSSNKLGLSSVCIVQSRLVLKIAFRSGSIPIIILVQLRSTVKCKYNLQCSSNVCPLACTNVPMTLYRTNKENMAGTAEQL